MLGNSDESFKLFFCGHLDAVGNEAEDGAKPEEHGKAREETFAEFDPLRHSWGRRQRVWTVLLDAGSNQVVRQPVLNGGLEPLAEHVHVHLVHVDLELLLQLVEVLALLGPAPHVGDGLSSEGGQIGVSRVSVSGASRDLLEAAADCRLLLLSLFGCDRLRILWSAGALALTHSLRAALRKEIQLENWNSSESGN